MRSVLEALCVCNVFYEKGSISLFDITDKFIYSVVADWFCCRSCYYSYIDFIVNVKWN